MGYRSEVKMLFKFNNVLTRDLFIKKAEEICHKYETKDNTYIFKWGEKSLKGEVFWLVEWEDAKWYTGSAYAHVDAWEEVKASASDWSDVS